MSFACESLMVMFDPAFLFFLGTVPYLLLMMILAALFAGGIYFVMSGDSNRIDAGRRSFLTGRAASDHALFFGVQMVIQIFGSDELRGRLARLVASEGEMDAQEKRRFMKSVAALLLENQYAWEYGYWEFIADAESAISTFNEWRNEIEASMATEPDELGSETDRLHRFSDNKEYLIVTLMVMLDNREEPVEDDIGDYSFRPTYTQLANPFRATCEGIDEAAYWTPATFKELLEGLRAVDPRAIERDGIYVYPGTAQDGISSIDLISESGWKYLTDHSLRS